MKQPFICIAALTLLFAACKKEDAAPAPPVIVKKYVQSIISDAGDSTAIEFNIDKSVYKLLWFGGDNSFRASTPTYESGTANITKVSVSIDPLTYGVYEHQEITYNSMKQIHTISFYGPDGSLESYDSLSYSGTGKLDTIYDFRVNGETGRNELSMKYIQTWDAKDNIVKQEQINVKEAADYTVTTYTYDDKINPALKLTGYYTLNFGEDELAELLSANNILTALTVNPGTGYSTTARNTYVYDADNYPVAITFRTTNQSIGQDTHTDSVMLKLNYGR